LVTILDPTLGLVKANPGTSSNDYEILSLMPASHAQGGLLTIQITSVFVDETFPSSQCPAVQGVTWQLKRHRHRLGMDEENPEPYF